ncbi:hypothetical protein UFOVP448_16 [uncultured Caudovirales phage]|uniref:Uncharacterized protein n=1 Tax=uncultured Caudovirales phage TaxID=2100421 RepID=A0A6J5M8L2_9CAUD|nr:hypothetical protein UFOVP448_16 [uncultured Caudovirales phage]
MIVLKVKTKNGHIQELQVEELISVDGKPYQLIPNIEERILELERTVVEIVNWINTPPPVPDPNPPSEERSSDATVRN